jgi:cysteine desulfurase/selenocysteine lyase
MLVGNNNRLLVVSCITTLTTIIRFRSLQRSLPTSFCSALSPGPRSNLARIQYLTPFPMTFSSSTTESALPSSSSSSLFLSASQQPQAQRQRVHLNHAGASPSPQRVLDRVYTHLKFEQEDGGYAAQNAVQDSGELNKVYRDVAKLIHATTETPTEKESSSSLTATAPEIALVESATVGWTRAFYAMVQRDEQERKASFKVDGNHPSATTTRVILISEAEYAANVVAACQWARDHDDHWMVLAIPSSNSDNGSSTGMVDLEVFDSMLEGNFRYKNKSGEDVCLDPSSIAMVCITHVPTNSGIVNPVEGIGERISTYNKLQKRQKTEGSYLNSIKYVVDACQSVGQMDVNVQKIKCDALVATG